MLTFKYQHKSVQLKCFSSMVDFTTIQKDRKVACTSGIFNHRFWYREIRGKRYSRNENTGTVKTKTSHSLQIWTFLVSNEVLGSWIQILLLIEHSRHSYPIYSQIWREGKEPWILDRIRTIFICAPNTVHRRGNTLLLVPYLQRTVQNRWGKRHSILGFSL